MDNLFIWYCTTVRRKNGIPQHEDIWIRENFTYGKEIEGLNYDWLDYDYSEHGFPPISNSLRLPRQLYLIFQKQKSLSFDFLPYRKNMFIVSEEFKYFIEKQLQNKPLEFSKLIVVHKSNKEFLPQKEYFLLRIITFDDDLFEFVEDEKKHAVGVRGEFIYPNLKLKEKTNQEIFFLDSFCYQEAMIFTAKIKDEIKTHFYSPEVYNINDFYLAFNNNSSARIENLPNTV